MLSRHEWTKRNLIRENKIVVPTSGARHRRDPKNSDFEFGIDYYLCGYGRREFDLQTNKLNCDNVNQYAYCVTWHLKDTEWLSAVGMQFYRREIYGLSLRSLPEINGT